MLNLATYKLTFDEEFNTRSISQNGEGTRWADIRPEFRADAHSDAGFGLSSFLDPSSGYDPFKVANGELTITAQPDRTPSGVPGSWESGLIHTRGKFSQKYGYFEIRADLTDTPGGWDAFWLLPNQPSTNIGTNPSSWQELDIVEHYGNDPNGIYTHIHTTHSPAPGQTWSYYHNQPLTASGYHTYGALWTPTGIELYYDGNLVGTKAVPADYDVPMFILANLAVEQNGLNVNGPQPQMKIDYIRVFSSDPNAVAVNQDTISAPDGNDPGLYGATTASGPSTPTPSPTPSPTTPTDLVFEPGDLKVTLSGDQYGGEAALAEISVNGLVVGKLTVTADHSEGEWQDIIVKGQGRWADGTDHNVKVTFLNDAYGGTPTTDRNLWFKSVELNGVKVGTERSINSGGESVNVKIDDSPVTTSPTTPSTPTLQTINGTSGNDMLYGTDGIDTMYGGAGNDTYHVKQVGDQAYEQTGQGTDTVICSVTYSLYGQVVENLILIGSDNVNGTGNGLNNKLSGNSGANTLKGEGANDVINGNGGRDILFGGSGRDTFVFDTMSEANSDTISDFNSGADRINLKTIDANTRTTGDQAFTFIRAQNFHKVVGELRAYQANGNTYIAGDTNGDGIADFTIKTVGAQTFSSADFVL